jgi:hypothetical protein
VRHHLEFVYVITKTDVDWTKLPYSFLCIYLEKYLYSLINGLKQKEFGLNTIHKTSLKINEVYNNSFKDTDGKLYIDSGGYSIIVGDVHPNQIVKFMHCYNYFLSNFCETSCDYLFSLDIPIFLKYLKYNTYNTLYQLNKQSLTQSFKIIQNNPILYNKFMMVWQFKILNQYRIWNKIYHELPKNIVKNIRNYAIGGMVGLRGITGIQFSPFVSMVYKLLYLLYINEIENGSIHLLGIYGKHDRFIGNFLSKLFNEYYKIPIKISYDTINYKVSGFNKSTFIISFDKSFENLTSILNIDKESIEYLCCHCNKIVEEISSHVFHLQRTKTCLNTEVPALLHVAYERISDFIIEEIIERENLVELFVKCQNYNRFKNFVKKILSKYGKYKFINNYLKKILLNFQYVYVFHDWWMKSKDINEFERLNEKFIQLINFPFQIT